MRFFDFSAGNGRNGNFYASLLTLPEASPRVLFAVPALLGVFFPAAPPGRLTLDRHVSSY
jgi:hypothetical protein